MTTAKRVFLYLVSLVALALLAVGSGWLLSLCFDLLVAQIAVAPIKSSFNSQQLSLGLAMILIGGGLWLGFWRNIQKGVAADPVEIGTPFRKLYLNFVQLEAALTGLMAAISSLDWLLGGAKHAEYPPVQLATFIVASFVWFYHWRLSEKEGQPTLAARTLRRWYIYILSAWGLGLFSISIVLFIGNAASFLPIWGSTLIHGSFVNDVLRIMSGVLVGGLTWGFFWFRMARNDAGSTLRQIYFYLITISGSAIAGLTALAATLYWLIGFAAGLPAGDRPYFHFLVWTLPTMIVAAGVWLFHHKLAQEEAAGTEEKHLSARRVYLYLMSVISLGTLIAGMVALIGILLDVIITTVSRETIINAPGWWQGQLSMSLALLGVGVPIWIYYWRNVLKMTLVGGTAERRARSRRIFLYAVLGFSILATVASSVNLIYLVLNALLQSGSPALLRSMKGSLQALAVALPLLIYFWRIVKSDQRLGAETVTPQKEVTVVFPQSGVIILERLEALLGYRTKALLSLADFIPENQSGSDDELNRLKDQIQSAPGNKVMLVMDANQWLVIPYQER
jgi:hypothetical protein